MADSVQGVGGRWRPALDAGTTPTEDNVQGVNGSWAPVVDPAAGAGGGATTINLEAIAVEVTLPALGIERVIALESIAVVVALPDPTIGSPQTINLEAIAVEVTLPALGVVAPIAIDLESIAVEVALPDPTLTNPYVINLEAIAVVVALPDPAISVVIELEAIAVVVTLNSPTAVRHTELFEGYTGAIIERPGGLPVVGLTAHIQAVTHWETRRALNQVGTWTATIPAFEPLVSTRPLADMITRGWLVSLVQENTHPLDRLDLEYLLYRGVVEDKRFSVDESGQTVCELSGSFRGAALAARSTPTSASYTAATVQAVAEDIEGAIAGGVTVPTATANAHVTLSFNNADGNGILSRYTRLLRLGEYARLALRESWEADAPEFVRLDDPPDSGYTLVNVEAGDASMSGAAAAGLALIGGTPEVRREGRGIVNRIIPFGEDTITVGEAEESRPLTLQHSNRSTPYAVKTASNGDGSSYYYIEDAASILRHGVIEMAMHRSDVKNPSDNAGTRQSAANVLHAVASATLLKHKSPKVFVTVPVANGPHVWALPGDKIKLQYTGAVETDYGAVTWQEFDQWFLVVDRRDASTPAGVREVEFTLAAPEIEITVPASPNAVVLPVTNAAPVEPLLAEEMPGGSVPGEYGGSSFPDCCADPTTTVEDSEVEPPDTQDADDGSAPVSAMLIYLHNGTSAILAGIDGDATEWEKRADSPGGLAASTGPLFGLDEEDAALRMTAAGGSGYGAAEFGGTLALTTNSGSEWSSAATPGDGTYEQMYSVVKRGGLYAPIADDDGGTTPGNGWRIYVSEDNGSTWARYGAGLNIEFVGIVPDQIAEVPSQPGVFLVLGHGDELGAATPFLNTLSPVRSAASGAVTGFDSVQLALTLAEADFNQLFTFGAGDRVVIAIYEAGGASNIYTLDIADWLDLTAGIVQAYSGGDLGRPIGLAHRAGTDVLFAAFEDGTVLRSTDNGDSWEALDYEDFGDLASAHALAYDDEQDVLWLAVVHDEGVIKLEAWPAASTTDAAAVNGTRNLDELAETELGSGREPGRLGMIVWPGPQPRLINLELIDVTVATPDLIIGMLVELEAIEVVVSVPAVSVTIG